MIIMMMIMMMMMMMMMIIIIIIIIKLAYHSVPSLNVAPCNPASEKENLLFVLISAIK